MKISIDLYLDETYSADELDELSELVREAIEEKVASVEYIVQDIGLNFEL